MKCPICNKILSHVFVTSEFTQRGDIDEEGHITDYFSIDDPFGATLKIECPHCWNEIAGSIKES